MEASLLTNLLLPLALGIVMLGLGLGLTTEDFRRIATMPRPVFIGLGVQVILLPGAAFVLAKLFGLPPELAVGLMLLAASPGGATANIYSHLAKGDVALNITLTATNSILCLVTLPIVLNLSLLHFMGEGNYVPPPFVKVIEVAVIILVPVLIGMTVRRKSPGFAARMDRPVRAFSVLVLAGVIAAAVVQEWSRLPGYFATVGLVCLLFNVLSLAAGYLLPRAIALPRRQAIAIAMEIGIHNGTLAIFIALNVLGSAVISIPAVAYSLIMFFTAAAFAVWLKRPGAEPAA
ncbi:MAG: bile acid:sodium symporter family protein [Opitutaceae bacterium]|nr:bile acid:sodium symporter family protein [Opitutaceae bacterium]